MRILMIGGTGFIGVHVVRQLALSGHEVTVCHRGQTRAILPDGVNEIVQPQCMPPAEGFPGGLLSSGPDVVIHTVAMGAADAEPFVQAISGRTGRLVLLSSGDVYRAYGRFTGFEPGPAEAGLLSEDSPLRTKFFPYRKETTPPDSLHYRYEKILAERAFLSDPGTPGTVLRLPKVYGPGGNQDLATIYGHRLQPNWRWTHGFVEDVAAAIALAATHPLAAGRVYNVGENYTPTIAERLACLPPSTLEPDRDSHFDFTHDLAFDTTRIRSELDYREIVGDREGFLRTLQATAN
jgi:nucleoside-diphosphate-sugar epimerase